MFGYIRPLPSEMKVKEHHYYKSVYCGLCHGEKRLARSLRYSLSYDMVTLALARIGVTGEVSCFARKKCALHPARGCLCVVNSASLDYTASVAALLVYHKLLDDLADERGFRRLGARWLLRSAKKAMAVSPLPTLAATVKEKLQVLSGLEAAKADSVYDGAEVFGALLGEVFAYGMEDGEKGRILFELGNRMGRFIFILDVYADRAEDRKEGRYNPLLLTGEDTEGEAFRAVLMNALDWEVTHALAALDALVIADKGVDAILRNIIALGMPHMAETVILKKKPLSAPRKRELDRSEFREEKNV